jgi:non-ribosomal peptide synthetase component F
MTQFINLGPTMRTRPGAPSGSASRPRGSAPWALPPRWSGWASAGGPRGHSAPQAPAVAGRGTGLWRLGAIHVPLFTAFGPEAIRFRVQDSGTKVVVIDAANRPKIPDLADVIIVEVEQGWQQDAGTANQVELSGEDPFILSYTSGTTGHPKGVVVPVKALASFAAYMSFGLDVRPDDVHWTSPTRDGRTACSTGWWVPC